MATLEKNVNFSGKNWGGYARITYTAQDGTVSLTKLEFKATNSTSAGYGAYYDNSQTRTFTLNNTGVSSTVKNVRIKQTSYYATTLGTNPMTWTGVPDNSTLNFTVQARASSPNTLTYNFTIPMSYSTYTISYSANGGSSTPSSQTKTYGTNLTIANGISHSNTTQNGYTVTFNANNGSTTKTSQTATDTVGWSFSGWKSSATGTVWSGGATNFSENNTTTLTAQWSTSISSRGSVTLPTTAQCTRTNYTLLGWSTSSSATSASWSPGATYTPDTTRTLYAVWQINTASFNLNILNPDGSEPYSTGEAGTVEQSINGGSYTRIYNEQASSYPIGTTFNYRNFIGGTGRHLSSVSGITPNNTTGPWSATLGSGGLTVNFYTAWNSHTLTYYPRGGTYNGTTSNSTFTQNYGTTKNLGTPTPPTGNIFAGYHTNGSLTGISSSDSVFENGNGGIGVYNNSGNGTVTHTRSRDDTVPSVGYGSGSIGYKITINKAAGTASPGCGGFYLGTNSKANHIYRCFIWAKIPTTHYIQDYRNAIGDGGYSVWLTGQKGTGDWYKYVYEVHAGSSGTFSSFGHVALNAINGDNSTAVTWEVCATQITDISDSLTFTYDDADRYVECYQAPQKIKLTLNPSPGSGGTTEVWYTYGISSFYNNSMCTSQINNITVPTRTYYTFDRYNGDGSSGGSNPERYIYADGTFASDLATDIYKDATLYAVWTASAPTAATISITNTVRDKASVSLEYTGVELTDYTVYYRPNSTGTYSSTSLGTSSTGTITGLQPNTSYQFYVTATNPGGSKDSSTTTATTKAYTPNVNIPTASGITDTESTIGVSATGDTNAGITNYTLYWAPKPNLGRDLYDMPIKVTSDNAIWARIFYHQCKEGSVLFNSLAEAKNTQTTDKYSRLGLLDSGDTYKIDGKYEFMLCYPNNTTQYNRWKQTNAPQNEFITRSETGGQVTGYEAVHIDWTSNYWGGLERNNESTTSYSPTWLDGSCGHGNWFYAIGAASVHGDGIPSYASTFGCVELWIRVGTLSSAPSSQNMGTSTSTTITGLTEDTDYLIWATATNGGGTISSPSLTIHTPIGQSTVWVKINGTWVKGKVWYNDNGTWIKAKKFYTKESGSWIENKTTG